MARERDGTNSFDPRTWGSPGESPPVGAKNGHPEGRPRNYGAAMPIAAPITLGQRVPTAAPVDAPLATHSLGKTSSTALLPVAYGVSALLLVAGVATARFFPSALPSAPALAQSGATPPAETAGPSRQTLVVATPADIATTLRSAGVATEVADGAAQEVGSVLGTTTGDIRLVIDLTGPDTARELTRLAATRDRGGVVLTARPDGSYSSEPTQPQFNTGM